MILTHLEFQTSRSSLKILIFPISNNCTFTVCYLQIQTHSQDYRDYISFPVNILIEHTSLSSTTNGNTNRLAWTRHVKDKGSSLLSGRIWQLHAWGCVCRKTVYMRIHLCHANLHPQVSLRNPSCFLSSCANWYGFVSRSRSCSTLTHHALLFSQ